MPGVTYLCRAGQLVAIDSDLRKTVLYTGVIPNHSNSLALTRVLITGSTRENHLGLVDPWRTAKP